MPQETLLPSTAKLIALEAVLIEYVGEEVGKLMNTPYMATL